jgi:hypothetical protein
MLRKTHVLCAGLAILILAFAVACGSDNPDDAVAESGPGARACTCTCPGARTGTRTGPCTVAATSACSALRVHNFSFESAVAAGGDRNRHAHDRSPERRHHDRSLDVRS